MQKPNLRVVAATVDESPSRLEVLERRVLELKGYERPAHEESFLWEPRKLKLLGFTITLGSRRVPQIGTVARRLLR